MSLYRDTRGWACKQMQEVKSLGYDSVALHGDTESDLADVCRLTGIEQRVRVVESSMGDLPTLVVQGRHLRMIWPGRASGEEGRR